VNKRMLKSVSYLNYQRPQNSKELFALVLSTGKSQVEISFSSIPQDIHLSSNDLHVSTGIRARDKTLKNHAKAVATPPARFGHGKRASVLGG
jgi:hypothetical protein